MPKLALALLLTCALGSAGCREAPRRAAAPPAPVGGPAVHHLPPVSAEWILVGGKPTPGGTLDLRLRLTRHGTWPLPVRVRITLPEGAHLVRGDVRREVVLDSEDSADLELQVQLDRVPADDLVARVHSGTGHAGLHAEPRYRFGRPEPRPPTPPRAARPLLLGGRSFGAPVAMPR